MSRWVQNKRNKRIDPRHPLTEITAFTYASHGRSTLTNTELSVPPVYTVNHWRFTGSTWVFHRDLGGRGHWERGGLLWGTTGRQFSSCVQHTKRRGLPCTPQLGSKISSVDLKKSSGKEDHSVRAKTCLHLCLQLNLQNHTAQNDWALRLRMGKKLPLLVSPKVIYSVKKLCCVTLSALKAAHAKLITLHSVCGKIHFTTS